HRASWRRSRHQQRGRHRRRHRLAVEAVVRNTAAHPRRRRRRSRYWGGAAVAGAGAAVGLPPNSGPERVSITLRCRRGNCLNSLRAVAEVNINPVLDKPFGEVRPSAMSQVTIPSRAVAEREDPRSPLTRLATIPETMGTDVAHAPGGRCSASYSARNAPIRLWETFSASLTPTLTVLRRTLRGGFPVIVSSSCRAPLAIAECRRAVTACRSVAAANPFSIAL